MYLRCAVEKLRENFIGKEFLVGLVELSNMPVRKIMKELHLKRVFVGYR